jgi:predicted nucleic acid-binding protein
MYLDSSIIVKLFVPEPDSLFYAQLADRQTISSSALAYTEVWSALLRKERGGAISPAERIQAWEQLSRDLQEERIELLPVTGAILKRANRILAACHPQIPLRSLDALHLAACDQAQDWPLVTADERMRAAAILLSVPIASLPS